LLTGRTAPEEESDRLVLTPDTVVVVVVAGPDGGADAPRFPDDPPALLDLRLNQPRQLMSSPRPDARKLLLQRLRRRRRFRDESPAQAQRTASRAAALSRDRRVRAYASCMRRGAEQAAV
jgi:hypothetical protein